MVMFGRSNFQWQRRLLKDTLWPDLNTIPGRRTAVLWGAVVAGFLAVSFSIILVLLLATGSALSFTPANELSLQISVGINAILIAAAATLCYFIWIGRSHVAAWIMLIWIITHLIIILFGSGKGLLISVIALIGAIHGIRGTHAMVKFAKRQEKELAQDDADQGSI